MDRSTKADSLRAKVAELTAALPEATANPAGNHLSLEVRGKRFGWFLDDHHDDGRIAINCKATKGVNQSLAGAVPQSYHIPKYVGHHGWVGLWLDVDEVDWSDVAELLKEAYRLHSTEGFGDHSR